MLRRSGHRGHPHAQPPGGPRGHPAERLRLCGPQREPFRQAQPHQCAGGECDVGVESTVVSVVGDKPTLFRPGHITLEDLERALGEEVEVSKAILEKLPEGAVVRSPGMKYKHYAPKADVTLLNGCASPAKPKSWVYPAWNMAARATVLIRRNTSSAPCARWTNRAMPWSMPAARRRMVCPWRCTTGSSVWGAAGRRRPDQPRDSPARFAAAARTGPAVRGRYPFAGRHAGPPPAGRPRFCHA